MLASLVVNGAIYLPLKRVCGRRQAPTDCGSPARAEEMSSTWLACACDPSIPVLCWPPGSRDRAANRLPVACTDQLASALRCFVIRRSQVFAAQDLADSMLLNGQSVGASLQFFSWLPLQVLGVGRRVRQANRSSRPSGHSAGGGGMPVLGPAPRIVRLPEAASGSRRERKAGSCPATVDK
jgi:hypothetical protein